MRTQIDRISVSGVRFLTATGMSLLLSSECMGSYYDGSAENEREHVYGYLDQVESEAEEAFGKIQGDLAVYVAKRMGYIDRDALDAASFCEHILTAQEVRERFYEKAPLDDAQFKRYLLPLRIKHEYTRKNWLPTLSKQFVPLTKDSQTADEAAEAVLAWVRANLSLKPQKEFYLMTTAGDLDVFSVLKEKSGHEIDLTIFTVSALRSAGVAARIVWTPILRGERGGKLWLEYWSERGEWVPWMASISKTMQTKANLLEILKDKTGMIFVHQDSPQNITETYFQVCEVQFNFEDRRIASQMFLLGSQGLIAVKGHQTQGLPIGKKIKIARGGEIYLAVTKAEVAYFLTRVNLSPEECFLEVHLEDGKPVIERETDKEIGEK